MARQVFHAAQKIGRGIPQRVEQRVISARNPRHKALWHRAQQVLGKHAAAVRRVHRGKRGHLRRKPQPRDGPAAVQPAFRVRNDVHLFRARFTQHLAQAPGKLFPALGHRQGRLLPAVIKLRAAAAQGPQ